MAIRIARPLHLFAQALRPAIVVLNGVSNYLLRAIGIKSGGEFEGEEDDLVKPIDHTLADTQIGVGYGVTTLPHLRNLGIVCGSQARHWHGVAAVCPSFPEHPIDRRV